ncbi:MAG: NAD-dependent epimerase/dehydratase family protein [Patescibacteria group bacterium]
MQKRALVCGAGGFIGHNMVKFLKARGWQVIGVDLKEPSFEDSPADVFNRIDLRDPRYVGQLLDQEPQFDRVYQFAADMGGAAHVFSGDFDSEILVNSALINMNILRRLAEIKFTGIVFYSSSVCIYPDEIEGLEHEAYPVHPPSNYGYEKMYSERMYQAFAHNYGLNIRIARFHNCFGPGGVYEGGREKSPAAISRKVALATDGGEIEIWGDGEQLRPFIYIDDLILGIEALMTSDFEGPVNLGPDDSKSITINQLVDIISDAAGKKLVKKHIDGPTGGQIRHANNDLAQEKLGWKPEADLWDSLAETYHWIAGEISKKSTM